MRVLYLRDDDVFEKDKCLEFVFNFLIDKRIKCSYSVIPSLIKSELIAFLNSNLKNKRYFDIVQHGYSHSENAERTEFGANVDFNFQKKFIAKGFDKLKKLFPELFCAAYVPPFHNYDLNTVAASSELGFKAISASRKIFEEDRYKIKFLFCDVNLNEYKNGVSLPIDVSFVKKLTLEKIKKREVVGVYFHHSTFSKYDNMKRFLDYVDFVEKLEEKGIIKLKKISDLI
ncbi:MAG TPA: DUF2334 domain-containing protein [Elusimicrobiales bacterium]|nr:DUF2334 domain-containing protein [Elusimicrobiales bacterium]HPO95634.1 DUF2334 domain-containing protein [Elusimicrobiales bacterium]